MLYGLTYKDEGKMMLRLAAKAAGNAGIKVSVENTNESRTTLYFESKEDSKKFENLLSEWPVHLHSTASID